MIGILFRGKVERHTDTGWEPFSNLAISGDLEIAEWEPIMERAESMGFAVKREDGTVYMWKNKNCNGRFMTAKGGHKIAQQFLDSMEVR